MSDQFIKLSELDLDFFDDWRFMLVVFGLACLVYIFPALICFLIDSIDGIKTDRVYTAFSFESKESIVFIITYKNIFGYLNSDKMCIHLDEYCISEDTMNILHQRIQDPLATLYNKSLLGKRAKEAYVMLKEDLQSLMDEVKKSLQECTNPQMEKMLIDRLPVVEANINYMTKKLDVAIQIDEDEKTIKQNLDAEGYTPFLKTEMVNKLNDIDN